MGGMMKTGGGMIVLFGISAAGAFLFWSRKVRSNGSNGRQVQTNERTSEVLDLVSSAYKFPWEPSIPVTTEISCNKVSRLSSFEQKQQLDFLASMTFSNGGLRPPSCPCCQ
jgi:hypothetical protein